MSFTFGSLFAGGGLADRGLMDAGGTALWGVEYDQAIAAWHEKNIPGRTICADVCDVDYAALPAPDLLWASPVCTRASVANAKRGEAEIDRRAAEATARALTVLRPRWFVLENVPQYADFDSFARILAALQTTGYRVSFGNENSANYGVAQTRTRLILRATLDAYLPPLVPTHRNPKRDKADQMCLFGEESRLPVWRGWYQAVEDLLPRCPESRFAKWQEDRLPAELKTLLLSNAKTEWSEGDSPRSEPAFAVTGEQGGRIRAFLADTSTGTAGETVALRDGREPAQTVRAGANHQVRAYLASATNADGITIREGKEPAHVITASHANTPARAFLVDGKNIHPDGSITTRHDGETSFTITSGMMDRPSHAPRAFLLAGSNASNEKAHQDADSPSFAIAANAGQAPMRAFLVDGMAGDNGRVVGVPDAYDPAATINAQSGHKQTARAYTAGRVVKLTPRCLARFQSAPDDFALPDDQRLATRIIGNGAPSLLARRIAESLTGRAASRKERAA